jgi:hypothetical protein
MTGPNADKLMAAMGYEFSGKLERKSGKARTS